MPTVAVLPTDVADQIAAGEVVERPASVVKELIENALDAGASVVDVAVSEGGRSSIRVSDDGCGMDRADALLALQRHATSKIRLAADLVGVRSFGFRGEALPAIASVSHLSLETASATGPGTSVQVQGGTVGGAVEAARRRGTTVGVTRLFYNVPARLKFMRGVRSEWRAVADVVTSIALTRREVHLTLTHDGKPALALPPTRTLRERVAAVWGTAYADSLLDVDDAHGDLRITGLVERPSDVGTRTRRIHVSVNGRAIRDAGVVRAAEAAYRSTIPAGLRPTLLIELSVVPDTINVNVHPTKAEVRFRDRWPIERAVEGAVRRALGELASAATLGHRVWVGGAPGANGRDSGWPASVTQALGPAAREMGLESSTPWYSGGEGWLGLMPSAAERAPDAGGGAATEARKMPAATGQENDDAAANAPIAPPLVQLRRTYLLFEHDAGVVLIDQHSAHERVLYEQFVGALEQGALPSQHLLFPLTMHLSAAAADAFEENREWFARLGFEAAGFGGQTLVVHGVPAPHPRFDAERCLQDSLDALTGDREPGTAGRHERLAATVACKAAIKAGDVLSAAEMQRSVRCACPNEAARPRRPRPIHGRAPVVGRSRAPVRPTLVADGGRDSRQSAGAGRRCRHRSLSAPGRLRTNRGGEDDAHAVPGRRDGSGGRECRLAPDLPRV